MAQANASGTSLFRQAAISAQCLIHSLWGGLEKTFNLPLKNVSIVLMDVMWMCGHTVQWCPHPCCSLVSSLTCHTETSLLMFAQQRLHEQKEGWSGVGSAKTAWSPYLGLNLIVKELLLELGQGVVRTVVVKVEGIEHIPAERVDSVKLSTQHRDTQTHHVRMLLLLLTGKKTLQPI